MTEQSGDLGDRSIFLIWIVTGILAVGIIAAALYVKIKPPGDVRPVQPPVIEKQQAPLQVKRVEEPPPVPQHVEKQQVQEEKPPSPSPQEQEAKETTVPTFAELNTDDLPHLLTLSSSRFQKNKRLPLEHTCYRTNESPPLHWKNIPEGTESFALFLTRDDKEVPFVTWILFNIAADRLALSRNLPKTASLPDGSAQALTDNNNAGYAGPCEPKGRYKYTFRLFALDKKLAYAGGAKKEEILRAMRDHVLDAYEFVVVHYIRF